MAIGWWPRGRPRPEQIWSTDAGDLMPRPTTSPGSRSAGTSVPPSSAATTTRPAPRSPRTGQDGVPPSLAHLLLAAYVAELQASTMERRSAQRLTRQLLGAASEAGYSTRELAGCLGMSAANIRNRLTHSAWLTLSQIEPIFGIGMEQLQALVQDSAGRQTVRGSEPFYRAVDIVRVVAAFTLSNDDYELRA